MFFVAFAVFCQFECSSYFLIPGSSQSSAYIPLVTLPQEAFVGTNGRAHKGFRFNTRTRSSLATALCSCLISHLFLVVVPKEKSLTVSSQGLWSSWWLGSLTVCVFPSSSRREGAAVKQEALLEAITTLLFQLTAGEIGFCWLQGSCQDLTKPSVGVSVDELC